MAEAVWLPPTEVGGVERRSGDRPLYHITSGECGCRGEHLQVITDLAHLPFAAKSVDACLLGHSLGYAAAPRRVLREVDRVLVDDGWLIISGFSPFSLLGVGRLVPGLRRRPLQ